MVFRVERYSPLITQAVAHFWGTRNSQLSNQDHAAVMHTGNRSAVTGGKQLDGFITLLRQVAIDIGVPAHCIYIKGNHIPGYFRPTKDWDILIITPSNKLISVIELKSQVGSFGNNFNNRTEESLGSAVDFWTAYRENVFPNQAAPWVGYLMLVESSEKSQSPVNIRSPYFNVMPEFENSSYLDRYKILCEKLMLERYYSHCCLMWTNDALEYGGMADEIYIESFIYSFVGHLFGQLQEFR